jgi:carbon monoxide dehydrogenase subunit G
VASASSSRLELAGSSLSIKVADHDVTWSRRSWPAFAAAPPRAVRTARVTSSGPSRYSPGVSGIRRGYIEAPDQGEGTPLAVELDHSFTTSKSIDESFATITDLERVVPCVEGGRVIEATGPDSVKAEIDVKMGAMSMKFAGTVEVAEKDPAAHTAVMKVKSREVGGDGHANADVSFELDDGGGTIHTSAQIVGKAASMGEGVVAGVLDALIKDFAGKLGNA